MTAPASVVSTRPKSSPAHQTGITGQERAILLHDLNLSRHCGRSSYATLRSAIASRCPQCLGDLRHQLVKSGTNGRRRIPRRASAGHARRPRQATGSTRRHLPWHQYAMGREVRQRCYQMINLQLLCCRSIARVPAEGYLALFCRSSMQRLPPSGEHRHGSWILPVAADSLSASA